MNLIIINNENNRVSNLEFESEFGLCSMVDIILMFTKGMRGEFFAEADKDIIYILMNGEQIDKIIKVEPQIVL